MKSIFLAGLFITLIFDGANAQLKSLVYDFEGFDLGSTDLPEGDYRYGDLVYSVATNPGQPSGVLGEQCLRLDVSWNAGYAAFGRGISRYLQVDPQADRLNFFFYNNSSEIAQLELSIAEDDNNSLAYESASDDVWKYPLNIPVSAQWQFFSIPLKDFSDGNGGGNSVFDAGFSPTAGMLLQVEFRFSKPPQAAAGAQFYLDMISFSEGTPPAGNSVFDLPSRLPGDYCPLGAYVYEANGAHEKIAGDFEKLFPAISGKKLRYVNTYLQWSYDGSTSPNAFPGNAIQLVLDAGYRPIITWEPMFLSHPPLDPIQPTLQRIANGDYDGYIDAFAEKIKLYSDTVLIRPMHEFDGDWYPWGIANNGQDPQKYVAAYRHIVDRFRARGAFNAKWIWCPNSDIVPHRYWNWIVPAYPGDAYVDIVGTDIYNAHYPANLPWWRSFRWQAAEVYYYLTRYFPSKPLIICELGCRDRTGAENPSSQSKGEWYAGMDKALQSDFRKARALIFFNESTDHDWIVNSSASALQSLVENVWMDDYYFDPAQMPAAVKMQSARNIFFYPNPASGKIRIDCSECDAFEVYGADGKRVIEVTPLVPGSPGTELPLSPGFYRLQLFRDGRKKSDQPLLILGR